MDGPTIVIILIIVVVVIAMSSSGGDEESPSTEELGTRAHSANRFDDRDQAGMDDDGGE